MTAVPEFRPDGALAVTRSGRRPIRHRAAFTALALAVVVADQVAKALVVANAPFGRPVPVLGDWLRIWYVHNSGALFGLFRDQAAVFAALSTAVIVLIVWYHERAIVTHGRLATLTLGLLLGGALGNFVDRIRLGFVVDFVDMGIPGGWRFYTWNVADSAITASICLLLVMAVLPIAQLEAIAGRRRAPAGASGESADEPAGDPVVEPPDPGEAGAAAAADDPAAGAPPATADAGPTGSEEPR